MCSTAPQEVHVVLHGSLDPAIVKLHHQIIEQASLDSSNRIDRNILHAVFFS